MVRSRTKLTTKQVYLAPRAEAAAAAAAATATASPATDEADAELGRLQGLQLQEQQQQQQQQQLASAADRQHLEACYGLQDSSPNSSSLQEASTSSATTKRYLCYFLHRLLDLRVPELVALADMYGVPDVRCEAPAGPNGDVCPFWYVHLPNDQVAAQIVARAVLTRVSCCCCLDAKVACVYAFTGQ
jgi:hypothetical protein